MSCMRKSALAAGLLAAFAAWPCLAESKITYLLTSPSPNVAEAPHSSVPEVLGYWKDAGLDVEVKPFSGSTGATQLVIVGTAQFTMATPEGFIIARQEGAPLIAVYNHAREPIYTLAVAADSPIKTLADFKGKTIGVLSLASGALPVDKAMLTTADRGVVVNADSAAPEGIVVQAMLQARRAGVEHFLIAVRHQ